MKQEIKIAVDFITKVLLKRQGAPEKDCQAFSKALTQAFTDRFEKRCWDVSNPNRGSAFRCVRINYDMDPFLIKVCEAINLNCNNIRRALPYEITVWIDPNDVSYRIGEDGSIGVLFGDCNNGSGGSSGKSGNNKNKGGVGYNNNNLVNNDSGRKSTSPVSMVANHNNHQVYGDYQQQQHQQNYYNRNQHHNHNHHHHHSDDENSSMMNNGNNSAANNCKREASPVVQRMHVLQSQVYVS